MSTSFFSIAEPVVVSRRTEFGAGGNWIGGCCVLGKQYWGLEIRARVGAEGIMVGEVPRDVAVPSSSTLALGLFIAIRGRLGWQAAGSMPR